MPEISGASILVTGASGGLGSAICRNLAARGARLTLVARDRQRLVTAGLDGEIVPADIRDPGQCRVAVDAAVRRYGSLDGVVNAAGVVAFGPLEELRDEVLGELFATNVFGPVFLARASLAHLTPGGFLANVSAVVAETPMGNMAAYSASKAALTALDTALTRELRRRRVLVVDVRPPHTETGLHRRPIAGNSPALPVGLEPVGVAARIVTAIADGERDVPSSAFG